MPTRELTQFVAMTIGCFHATAVVAHYSGTERNREQAFGRWLDFLEKGDMRATTEVHRFRTTFANGATVEFRVLDADYRQTPPARAG